MKMASMLAGVLTCTVALPVTRTLVIYNARKQTLATVLTSQKTNALVVMHKPGINKTALRTTHTDLMQQKYPAHSGSTL
jgi:hypothetical protein